MSDESIFYSCKNLASIRLTNDHVPVADPVGGVTKVEAESDTEAEAAEGGAGAGAGAGDKMSYPGGPGAEHGGVPGVMDTDTESMYRVQQPFSHHR